ncbi:MAG: VOC family protein, partial [bacterium]
MSSAFAYIPRDDVTLWLSGPQSSAARPMPDGRRPEPGGWNRFRNEIVVGPGGKQILAEDPDGNPVEFFEPAS